jgi:hypothetical protein
MLPKHGIEWDTATGQSDSIMVPHGPCFKQWVQQHSTALTDRQTHCKALTDSMHSLYPTMVKPGRLQVWQSGRLQSTYWLGLHQQQLQGATLAV